MKKMDEHSIKAKSEEFNADLKERGKQILKEYKDLKARKEERLRRRPNNEEQRRTIIENEEEDKERNTEIQLENERKDENLRPRRNPRVNYRNLNEGIRD